MNFIFDYGTDLITDHFVSPSIMRSTHTHAQYELYFCSEDVSQTSVINGVEYSYKYPCAILSPPYTVHLMSCAEDAESYDRYVFYFGERIIDDFGDHHLPKNIFEEKTGLFFKLSIDEAKELKGIAQLLCSAQTFVEKELVFALFINKLICLCPDERIEKIVTPSFYIQDVLQFVSENFEKELTTEKIARHFAVSRAKLERDFRKFTGNTVHNFIDVCRVKKAKNLLLHRTDMSIGEVASTCGFENENYFFPFFKKIVGMTPAEYRKSCDKSKTTAVTR